MSQDNALTPVPGIGPGARPSAVALRQERVLQAALASREEAATLADDKIHLKDIFRTLNKHKWLIAGITALALLASAILTLRATPLYRASVMLQIDKAAQKVVGFNTEVELDQGSAADQLQLRTQIEMLKSRTLAERVIDEMGLHKRSASAGLPDGSATVAAGALPGAEPPADAPSGMGKLFANFSQLMNPSIEDELTLGREDTVAAFQQSVTIAPVRNSRLVQVQVLNSNAELAARIANQMAKTFIAINLERKLESSVYARQFLEDQIRQTKAKLEESERVINDYAKRNAILNLGDKTSASTQNFVDFSAALARAEQDRFKAEAQYDEVRLSPESAPRVLDNLAVQAYKEQKAKLEAEYAKNLAVFKPEFPAMLQAKAQINELQARIDAEVQTVLRSIKGQFEAAKRQEELLRNRVSQTRNEVLVVQDRSVDMNLLQRELDTNRQVYDSLLQRLKEVSVTGGLTTNNLSVVDEAKTPLYPHSPRPTINLGLGLVLGLFVGMLAALLREQLDDSIKHSDEVETFFGLPLLGWIPRTEQLRSSTEAVALQAHTDPRGGFAEAYRSMRTALQFSTPEGAPKRIMVTSCGKSEGKSTTALALAINFAQLGQQVLLIDADMRKASLHKSLRMPNDRGLSNLLSSDLSIEGFVEPSQVPNLSVLLSGPTPPDPVELLSGPKFLSLLEEAQSVGFSQVIIDGPPLLGIADAVVLGNQIEHIIFVVKAADTKKSRIKDALRRLRNAGLAPMGVVLTQAREEHSPGYGYGYESYYGYGEPTAGAPRLAARPGARGAA
jgi:capsular exopolysaccharide synthesis family protein